MKIEAIDTYRVGDRFLLVEIGTDSGLVGLGEAGLWGYPDAAQEVIEHCKTYLLGKDPLRIEHHYQFLYRNVHFRGAAISGALGGIDIALWDIAGKHYQAPVWQLLGGKCRDRVRCFVPIGGNTPQEMADAAQEAVEAGFKAVRVMPFPPGYAEMGHSEFIEIAVACVTAVREEVGPSVDVGVEIHRRLGPLGAVALAQELAPLRILFYEDPLLPDSVQTKGQVAPQIPLPIASGERLHTLFEFRELLETGACKIIRPDVCLAGGLTQCKKIVGMAESYQVGIIPHNPLSPVCTAACVQLEACIPNWVMHEYSGDDQPPRNQLLKRGLRFENGYVLVPDTPGIGVELNHEALDDFPAGRRPIEPSTPLRDDGSVADS